MSKQKRYDTLYMDLAIRISKMSHAERAKVGSVIVKDNNIISFGWNGTPAGFDNCCEFEDYVGHTYTKPEVIHSEMNAIAKLAKSGNSSKGATLYVTLAPCKTCSTTIIQAGIKRVVYLQDYHSTGLDLLRRGRVEVTKFEENAND